MHPFLRRRRRVLVGLGVITILLVIARGGEGASGDDHSDSLVLALENEAIETRPEAIAWIDEADFWGIREAVFIGRRAAEEQADLFYVEARTTAGGDVLSLSRLTDVSRSPGADDGPFVRFGSYLAYPSRVRGRFDAVTVIDLRGEPDAVTADWSSRQKLQNRVTNVQKMGRAAGFGRRRYSLIVPQDELVLTVEGERFVAAATEGRIEIDPEVVEPVVGAELVDVRTMVKGAPGTITWVVDTVRNTSFVGPEPIEWLEHRVFSVKDAVERSWHALRGTDEADTEQAVQVELGISTEERRRRLELSATDPESGWPPQPMRTVLRPALEAEGEWIPVVDDPFAQSYPNAPPALVQTFFRPDPDRRYARVYLTAFDPRLAQLRIMAGTREPESATGETGPGMAPRDPAVLGRLVAGFNGGFQALHGEFGMMSDGRVYLPPKPWAATVAVHSDGRVSMGSWTDPPEGERHYRESWAVEQIPEDVVEFRQNLTTLVEGEDFNPWARWWWGAAPLNAQEQVYIDRSGLCLTEEGFVIYFWGRSLGPEALGRAMLRARCVRGMHLDMNSRHTGLEFYNIRPDGEHPPLARALDRDAEFEGPLDHAPGFTIRARKMVTSMTPMRFPRYSGRDGRDFFYVTLKPVLPGPDLPGDGGSFDTRGLPNAGYPHAFARLFVGAEETGTWLVRIDPDRAVPAPLAETGAPSPSRILAYVTAGSSSGRFGVYAVTETVGRRFGVGELPEDATMVLAGPPLSEVSDAGAALGVDGDGFLVYAERVGESDRDLSAELRRAGVETAIALGEDQRLAFSIDGQTFGPDAYERPVAVGAALPLYANEAPPTEVLFPDTEPRRYHFWARMQDTRVRYFREGTPSFTQAGGGVRDAEP
ncbi:MAG: hypothetical protein AAGF12_12355 [Myxococcota bacterium]